MPNKRRTVLLTILLVFAIACLVEGDPCDRLCRDEPNYDACYEACMAGREETGQ